MEESSIFSIGHGHKKMEAFIEELKSFGIQYLLDIRSKPFSKWAPQFNQPLLELELRNHGITYLFVGDTLGGLPDDRSCYDEQGKVAYDLLRDKEFFRKGLQRLVTANEKSIPLAMMCSESDPGECHRSKLIGQELLKSNISVKHILSVNKAKTQQTVMNELTKGKGTTDLFGNQPEFRSRKSY